MQSVCPPNKQSSSCPETEKLITAAKRKLTRDQRDQNHPRCRTTRGDTSTNVRLKYGLLHILNAARSLHMTPSIPLGARSSTCSIPKQPGQAPVKMLIRFHPNARCNCPSRSNTPPYIPPEFTGKTVHFVSLHLHLPSSFYHTAHLTLRDCSHPYSHPDSAHLLAPSHQYPSPAPSPSAPQTPSAPLQDPIQTPHSPPYPAAAAY